MSDTKHTFKVTGKVKDESTEIFVDAHSYLEAEKQATAIGLFVVDVILEDEVMQDGSSANLFDDFKLNTHQSSRNGKNGFAFTGFVLGCISVVFYELSIFPVLAVVFSAIGISKSAQQGKRAISIIGLSLGILFLFMSLFYIPR
jgi:hypothetical protein